MTEPTYLAKLNKHERDNHVTFDEGPHIYNIDGDESFMSVTTWNHSHFAKFDADKIIKNMMKSKKWKQSKYFGQTPTEIKALWKNNGLESSKAGTKMHYDIECFYNKMEIENDSIEYKYFLEFHKKIKKMKPYRTEMIVWDKDLKLCGSIDMLYEHEDGRLSIYDWKRCKEIKTADNYGKTSTTECIDHLPDTNFWHYSLQLNTYRYLLEKNYGKKIKGMYLVCLHPNNPNGSFLKYKVPKLDDEINSLMKLRLSMVKKEKESLTCDTCYINKKVITYNKDQYGEKSLCDGCVSGKEQRKPYKECKYKKPY